MRSKLPILILLLAIFTSCKKTSNIDATVSVTGKLTYKLLDDAGKGLPNVRLKLRDNNHHPLDSRTADKNGLVDFGELNAGNYFVFPESPTLNKVEYFIEDYLQIIPAETKNKETKVSDYSGTFNFTISAYNKNNILAKDIGVLMIPTSKFVYNPNPTATYFDVADYKGITNAKGFVSFKAPSDIIYTVYLYNITTNIPYIRYLNVVVRKNQVLNMPLDIFL